MEEPSWMAKLTHRTVNTNGINMHVVEQGAGPVVLLLHGFPEFWYSWRYQIPALAEAGFRAVAPDLRGFGQSDAPKSVGDYTALHTVGDVIGLLDELGEERVFVVGHDWGAAVAWDLCLFRPDRVAACVTIAVPYVARNPAGSVLQMMGGVFGEGFYMHRFQEPGRAERDFEKVGTRASLAKFLFMDPGTSLIAPKDAELVEWMAMPEQPSHITDFDFQQYTENLERCGWTGGLTWYRNLDKSWELKGAWTNARVTSTCLFIAGKDDVVLKFPGITEYIEGPQFKKDVPNLRDIVMLEGGHFIQQEQGEKMNKVLISFLKGNLALASHPK